MSDQFNYKYTAPTAEERKEIDSIRRQYSPKEQKETKLERLRRLDSLVKNTAVIWSLVFGVIGTLILNVALSAAIAQMIFSKAHFTYIGWTIFAFAAYAFYKITMSIIALVKAHKQTDLTVTAIRNINLVDALVSILALQTALLDMFGDGTLDISLMNTMTGLVVSVASVTIGIYMIISANKKIKNLRKEQYTNERSI